MQGLNTPVEEIEAKLSNLLTICKLDTFVDVKKIKDWIANIKDPSDRSYLTMLGGLLDEETLENIELVSELVNTLHSLYMRTPLKALQNKTVAENLEEVKRSAEEEPVIVHISGFDWPPKEWILVYNDAMQSTINREFSRAAKKYDELFTILLNSKTTFRELYRIYANAGMAHILAGNTILGAECLRIANELNPNYDFAKQRLKDLENGTLDVAIAAGILQRMKDFFEERVSQAEHLQLDKVCQWPEQKILETLSKFGVQVNKEQFIEVAKSVCSTDDLADKLFYPQSKASGKDEDFIWMAASALWRLYCPDEPAVETLYHLLEEAADFAADQPVEKYQADQKIMFKYQDYFEKIKKFILTDKKNFINYWSETFEYDSEGRHQLLFFLESIVLYPEFEKDVLNLVETLKAKLPAEPWELVEIRSLIYKKDSKWKNLYEELRKKHPYDCYIAFEIGEIFEQIGDFEQAEQCYLHAWQIVDARAENKVWDLDGVYTTVYEDYKTVLNRLKKLYSRDRINSEKLMKVKHKLKEVEKNATVYSYSPRSEKMDESFSQLIEKIETKSAQKNPATHYYEFLKNYGINFATKTPVHTEAKFFTYYPRDFKDRKKRKVGPNERCPCGSGKKYKKCCMLKGR